jgi:hypothetical protein
VSWRGWLCCPCWAKLFGAEGRRSSPSMPGMKVGSGRRSGWRRRPHFLSWLARARCLSVCPWDAALDDFGGVDPQRLVVGLSATVRLMHAVVAGGVQRLGGAPRQPSRLAPDADARRRRRSRLGRRLELRAGALGGVGAALWGQVRSVCQSVGRSVLRPSALLSACSVHVSSFHSVTLRLCICPSVCLSGPSRCLPSTL